MLQPTSSPALEIPGSLVRDPKARGHVPRAVKATVHCLAAGMFILVAACGGGGASTGTVPKTAASIEKAGGDAQPGATGTLLSIGPRVIVRDNTGAPLSGITVNFRVLSGGGAISDTNVVTGSDGSATTDWYTGPAAGVPNVMRASYSTLTAEFTASSTAGAPGQAYHGRNNYIEYLPGDLPIIFTAPHGGTLEPTELPNRSGPNAVTVTDSRTEELAREIRDVFFARSGRRPHVIITRLRRTKIDNNRTIAEAAEGTRLTQRAWYEWHAFIDAAKAAATTATPWAYFVDLHGHGHAIPRLELGYLLTSTDLQQPDALLAQNPMVNKSSIRSLVQTSGTSLPQLLKGPYSIGTLFEAAGYPSVPSASQPHPGTADYFNGGPNTARHGSSTGGTVSGFQLEANFAGVRDTPANRTQFANAIFDVFNTYLAQHYGYNLIP